jgi:hypothetical protein
VLVEAAASLRKAQARTREALEMAITQALATITAADAHGWFAITAMPSNHVRTALMIDLLPEQQAGNRLYF